MADSVPPWVLVIVEPSTLVKDMTSGFNRIVATWTAKVFSWKELKMIFSYWSMTGDSP